MATNTDLLEIVPTRAMLQKGAKPADYKVTVFDENRTKPSSSNRAIENKTNRIRRQESNDEEPDDMTFGKHRNLKRPPDNTEFDMKRARHEVIKFGLSGFQAPDKKRAQIALAVKLGAKPPKSEYKNYKELLDEKKREKSAKEDEQKMLQLGKNQVGVASVRCQPKKQSMNKNKRKTNLGDISQNYGVTKPKIFKKKIRRN